MLSHLLRAPFPDGYGDTLLPLQQCKSHLSIDVDDDDELIKSSRDAAIDIVERYAGVSLGPSASNVWACEGLPATRRYGIDLMLRPVTSVTAITWIDRAGADVVGVAEDYRVGPGDLICPRGSLPWPAGIAGGVRITFNAGYPQGECPRALLQAVRLMLGHLWLQREGNEPEPRAIAALCRPFRRATL